MSTGTMRILAVAAFVAVYVSARFVIYYYFMDGYHRYDFAFWWMSWLMAVPVTLGCWLLLEVSYEVCDWIREGYQGSPKRSRYYDGASNPHSPTIVPIVDGGVSHAPMSVSSDGGCPVSFSGSADGGSCT